MKQAFLTQIPQMHGRLKKREWKEMRERKENLWGTFS